MAVNLINPTTKTVTTGSRNNRILDPTQLSRIGKLYSIFIVDETNEKYSPTASIDPAGRKVVEYFFNVPPKGITITEPFATNVVATQGGGKFVETHGSIFKEIRLEGTTGFRPNKKKVGDNLPTAVGNLPGLSAGIEIINSFVPGLDPDEITGHDDIIFLRNIFRAYSDSKYTDNILRMVFYNMKDDDYWVVEPMTVSFTQNSQSPFSYNYSITLKTITPFVVVGQVPDPIEAKRSLNSVFTRFRFYQQKVENAFAIIATDIRRIRAAGYLAVDTTAGFLSDVVRNLAQINTEYQRTVAYLKESAAQAKQGCLDAIEALKDIFDRQDPVIREFRRTVVICNRIITEAAINGGTSSTTSRVTSVNSNYTSNVTRVSSRTTVAVGVVNEGDTIRSLAQRLTGVPDSWRDIVMLNDLRAPYVSDDPTITGAVLHPGDSVLYPSVTATGSDNTGISSVALQSNRDKSNASQNVDNAITEAYGRDLRLKSNQYGTVSLSDIVVGQNGDFSTVTGVPNVEQAIRIKFSTEAGELPRHPSFGGLFGIGRRATPLAFNNFRLNVLATINSDSRISEILSLDMQTYGDILVIVSKLLLKDSKTNLSLNIPVRSP